ncbi:hypothetical protein BGW37DRAFT_557488 [Umbelopsis sp. PMI_123]|nr:hypothetical protein BGW37DRAFT_498776 [Umbelopsis sp. PMI_123]KAH8551626.1 hypothetical protein BGW37DRAFT_557488 [Umbelopsis sp. PMI_123]
MELSICLYCEKPLPNDTMTFCSFACRASEASKHNAANHHSYPLNFNRRRSLSILNTPSSSSSTAAISSRLSLGSLNSGYLDHRVWALLESASDASSIESL